jgi:hypothetical protein
VNTCTPESAPTLRQHPASVLPVIFDFADRSLAQRWRAGAQFSTTYRIRPLVPTGFEYEATTGGQTGRKEPIWPITIGATVVDGSCVWTCRAISTASLSATVSTVAWSADSGITVANESLQGQVARALVSGGTDGSTYRVTATATCSDGTRPVGEVFIAVSKAERCQVCSS